MPRPSITGKTIVVQVEDAVLTWTDGLLSSTKYEYLKAAKWLSEHGIPVDLTIDGPQIVSNLDDPEHPEQALAAMMGVVPGRARIVDAPQEILDLLPLETISDEQNDLTVEDLELAETLNPDDDIVLPEGSDWVIRSVKPEEK